MVGIYPIWFGKEQVGQVDVEQQGLYYHFYCRCRLSSDVMCRVNMSCNAIHASLGILVPVGDDHVLTKRIPIKQFSQGIPEFWITAKAPKMEGIRIDVYPEEPFRYIAKLEKAYLEQHRNKHRICIDGTHNAG